MRILVVEDDKTLANALQKFFEKEGNAVDCVYDGESAQRRIELYKDDYDVVILDLMLPKKDGSEVCKNVRANGIHIPILMLTGKGETNDKVLGLNNGADDYLAKPFSSEELLARMRALLRRPKKCLPPKLQIGNLVLDPVTREVFCEGRQVQLTLREFALLEYLMRNPNQVLDREQIFAHVWDFVSESFSNVVDVHFSHLRKKIQCGHPKHTELFETIRGVGYRLST